MKKLTNEDDEALRFENEFLKAKIQAQYGGVHGNGNRDTPPEILNSFLNNVIAFEEAMHNSKEVLLNDFIGRPEFPKEEDLNDEQLTKELTRFTDLLLSNNIVCINICPVEDRLLYKFLTEELIEQTVSDKSVPGMTTNFIYEDFHPDHKYDSRERCEEFIYLFFGPNFHQFISHSTYDKIKNIVDLCDFHNAFEEFSNVKFEFVDADVAPKECIRKATISFDAHVFANGTPIHYEGEATFELRYEYDWWMVVAARLPGMN